MVKQGTGTRAAVPDTFVAGKTGTTENYGDAWFVGWTGRYTVAVWVGYPDKLRADEDRVRRPAGRRRHVPGGDLHSFIENAFAVYPKKEKEKKKDEATGRRDSVAEHARSAGADHARARAEHAGARGWRRRR